MELEGAGIVTWGEVQRVVFRGIITSRNSQSRDFPIGLVHLGCELEI